ncbi:hypothetical protein N0M98_11555 [Paenibacillus doosanensis]|uniref:MarR family transcriptional regulator n=1 Tax=Paenibacillus konkukensis TaxID=2020716 RepID=A0ABY4RVW2_9BACL|nr:MULTISPECIES: hypothetical protein [Paenibacillus]MCS7460780.1 hypothetical protein [Paenibacillus doosanensis]UQZ85960.1 hypothetical protein SK3146_05252 [Paenibacillus konkukensis]
MKAQADEFIENMVISMQPAATSNVIQESLHRIVQCRDLLKLLSSKRNQDGVCHLSLKVLSNFMDLSTEDVSRTIRKLAHFGLIKSNRAQNEFEILKQHFESSPLAITESLLKLLQENPELTFQEQAARLDISVKDLEVVYGHFVYVLT